MRNLQQKCTDWALRCFGRNAIFDREERALRFLEEAIELAQASGVDSTKALNLLTEVYQKPMGLVDLEIGDAITTLSVLTASYGLDMMECGENTLTRCEAKMDTIRDKWLKKRVRSRAYD